ncbi:MAG: hypothetical protein HQL37_00785 [Alphaproteobacteria bacterium]|nr:hypothetical protein [Alphaproteobacteria bacterium]
MMTLQQAALVLVGHGSLRSGNARTSTCRVADEIEQRRLFAEVHTCFWKETPYIRDVLGLVRVREVFVVPNFAGEGIFTETVIPRELGIRGLGTQSIGAHRITYTPPVGAHSRVATLVRRRADSVIAGEGLDPATVCLLLVGHGSSRPGGSGKTAEALALLLRRDGGFGEVRTAYLEQEPAVTAWATLTWRRRIIVVPLLMAEGMHGSEDLPPLFGLSPASLASNDIPATHCAGRAVWYCRGIGSYPDIADIVLDLITGMSPPPSN